MDFQRGEIAFVVHHLLMSMGELVFRLLCASQRLKSTRTFPLGNLAVMKDKQEKLRRRGDTKSMGSK